MNIREQMEERELEHLSPYATFSRYSKGREREEEPCNIRPIFQRDRDRVLHCKSFRRLKQKTQVFLLPRGDHYRTRLTHTLEVSQNARTIAKALRLNEDLTEAIALAHDLGHTPFGHAGERALNKLSKKGFRHAVQGVRVVEKLEKDGKGLNLTKEVRDGILHHQTAGHPLTLEAKIVRVSDKVAYINHDIDDAIRGGILVPEDVPLKCRAVLGNTSGERLNTLINDIIDNSMDKPDIIMSEEVENALKSVRSFLFEHVYLNQVAKSEEKKAIKLIEKLYEYYERYPEYLPESYFLKMQENEGVKEEMICDYIAGMTDNFAVKQFQEIFIPKAWKE